MKRKWRLSLRPILVSRVTCFKLAAELYGKTIFGYFLDMEKPSKVRKTELKEYQMVGIIANV